MGGEISPCNVTHRSLWVCHRPVMSLLGSMGVLFLCGSWVRNVGNCRQVSSVPVWKHRSVGEGLE